MATVDDIKGDLTGALQELEALHGSVEFTYSGTDYVCVPGSEEIEKEMEDAGYIENVDLTIVVRQTVFATGKAALRGEIRYNGTTYRIEQMVDHAIGHSWVLLCKEEK